eukprot:9350741-Alexandrium_andersonii.AAC.1
MSCRKAISCNSEVDWRLNARIQARMPGPDRTLARRVNCLGVWCGAVMGHMGQTDTQECPWCEAPKQDWAHMWWSCPKFQDIRTKWWPEGVPDTAGMPAC